MSFSKRPLEFGQRQPPVIAEPRSRRHSRSIQPPSAVPPGGRVRRGSACRSVGSLIAFSLSRSSRSGGAASSVCEGGHGCHFPRPVRRYGTAGLDWPHSRCTPPIFNAFVDCAPKEAPDGISRWRDHSHHAPRPCDHCGLRQQPLPPAPLGQLFHSDSPASGRHVSQLTFAEACHLLSSSWRTRWLSLGLNRRPGRRVSRTTPSRPADFLPRRRSIAGLVRVLLTGATPPVAPALLGTPAAGPCW